MCPLTDRASLVAQLEPDPLAAQVADMLEPLVGAGGESVPQGENIAEVFSPWPRILDVEDDPSPITAADAA